MKSILISIAFLFMLSCASTPCKQCPSEDVYFLIEPGVPVSVPKGFFDNPDNYWTEDEFRKLLENKETSI